MRMNLMYLVYLVVIVCIYQYTFSGFGLVSIPFLSRILSQTDDLLIVILAVFVATEKLRNADFTVKNNFIVWCIVGFLGIFLISAIVNHVELMSLALSFKNYFIYPVFLLCVINTDSFVEKENGLLKILLNCYLIQIPIIFYQVIKAIIQNNFGDDTATGTLPGANNLSYSVFILLVYVTYEYIIVNNKKYAKYFWGLLFLLVVPMGEFAVALYFLLLPIFIIGPAVRNKRILKKVFFISFLTCIIMGIFVIVQMEKSSNKQSVLQTLSYSAWYERLAIGQNDVYSGAQRNLYFPLTYYHLHTYSKNPLFGFGPGMYGSYAAFQLKSPPNKLIDNAFNQIELGFDPGVDSQIIPIWGELGYIGILFYFLFLITAVLIFIKMFLKSTDQHSKAIYLTAAASYVFMIIGSYVNHVWETQPIILNVMIFTALALNKRKETSLRMKDGYSICAV